MKKRDLNKYTSCGVHVNGFYVGHYYNDRAALLFNLTEFIDPYEIISVEFLVYKGYNAVKVFTGSTFFYICVQPNESEEIKRLEDKYNEKRP